MTDKLLIPASRQYMHNDGSGLLCGYDEKITDEIVKRLQEQIENIKEYKRMDSLEKRISENIKFVFNNEQSFINEFAGTDQIGMVYSFFMGSAMHYVKFEYGNGGTTSKFIAADKFTEWKDSTK